jgi:hypothetical protein
MFWKYAEGRIVVYAQHCSASKIGFRWVTSSRPGSLSHINWTIQKPSESIYTTSHKPKELGTYFEDSQEFRIVLDLCDWDIPTEKKHSGKFLEILSNDEKTMDFTLTSNDQIDTPIHSLVRHLFFVVFLTHQRFIYASRF